MPHLYDLMNPSISSRQGDLGSMTIDNEAHDYDAGEIEHVFTTSTQLTADAVTYFGSVFSMHGFVDDQ